MDEGIVRRELFESSDKQVSFHARNPIMVTWTSTVQVETGKYGSN
jgi:hypothetical protein